MRFNISKSYYIFFLNKSFAIYIILLNIYFKDFLNNSIDYCPITDIIFIYWFY